MKIKIGDLVLCPADPEDAADIDQYGLVCDSIMGYDYHVYQSMNITDDEIIYCVEWLGQDDSTRELEDDVKQFRQCFLAKHPEYANS